MRLILSRKGFDSSAGGCPSPVLPDGSLCVLPIPDAQSRIRYSEVVFEERRLGKIARDLTGGRIRGGHGAHLDPDLVADAYPRENGWRPLLGQTGSAQGHLRNQGLSPETCSCSSGYSGTLNCIAGAGALCPVHARFMLSGAGCRLARYMSLMNWHPMRCTGPDIIPTSTASRTLATRSMSLLMPANWQPGQRSFPAVACSRCCGMILYLRIRKAGCRPDGVCRLHFFRARTARP